MSEACKDTCWFIDRIVRNHAMDLNQLCRSSMSKIMELLVEVGAIWLLKDLKVELMPIMIVDFYKKAI